MERLLKKLPRKFHFLGHDLLPVLREYRRASTTCIDSSLKPLMQKHFIELRDKLQQNHFSGQLFISTSAGSWAQVERIIDNPIHTTKSGPAMAPVAAKSFGIEGVVGILSATLVEQLLMSGLYITTNQILAQLSRWRVDR